MDTLRSPLERCSPCKERGFCGTPVWQRGAASWTVDLARSLTCPDCLESSRISPAPPASGDPPPALWERLGMDIFEYEFRGPQNTENKKAKFLILMDRASRFVQTWHLKTFPANENWEPSTSDIRSAIVGKPSPYLDYCRLRTSAALLGKIRCRTTSGSGRSALDHGT